MDNVYKAPEAALIDSATTAGSTAFFVTSIRKMAILYIATLGSVAVSFTAATEPVFARG
ncbi:hypothetical protein HNE05_03895 [Aquipseudomonas campi]|uniref:BURP domain-containing protein n=1 Tax=Aquipseudomonas campi TaxID=2731681 RepID=A0A6M8FZE7_9GAMM|nr:hypothetical protein [Pseudomonas campi]QKE62535.1 hypothetical protein HNE05_03895 [Pseudomonas campi]